MVDEGHDALVPSHWWQLQQALIKLWLLKERTWRGTWACLKIGDFSSSNWAFVWIIGASVALYTELDDQQKIDIHELTLGERCLLCRKRRFWVLHYKTHFVLVEISFQSLKVVICHKHGGWLLLCSKEFLYCERKHSYWTSNHPGHFLQCTVKCQFSSSSVQSKLSFLCS